MRIGMVTAVYEPVLNGVTRMVSQYKKYFEQEGHEVFVFTLGAKSEIRQSGTVVVSPGVGFGRSGYHFSFRYSKRAQIALNQMDIVHSHHPMMALEFARKYTSSPIIFTNHTRYDLYATTLTPLPAQLAYQWTTSLIHKRLNKSDWIIAPTKSMANLLTEWGVTRPIDVIGNGIELERFRQPLERPSRETLNIKDEEILLIYVGRLSPEKGVDALLDAFSKARSEVPRIRLLLIGGGPSRQKLSRKVGEMNIGRSVKFVDKVPNFKVPGYLAMGDVFVTGSSTEVHPLTVMEAMAAGLPIVGYKSPALTEIVKDGKNGILCSNQIDGLSAGIVELSRNHDKRKRMGTNASAYSEQFNIQTTIAATLELYERALSGSHRLIPRSRRLPHFLFASNRH